MNERLSTKAAEDMLSSIRRLVADEVGTHREERSRPARLLLTQALRVEVAPAKPIENRVRPLRTVLIERRAAQHPLILSEDLAVAPEALTSDEAVSRSAEPLRLVPAAPAAVTQLGQAAPAEDATDSTEPCAEAVVCETGGPEDLEAASLARRLVELEMLLDAQAQPYEAEDGGLPEEGAPWLGTYHDTEPFIALDLTDAVPPAPVVGDTALPAEAPLQQLHQEAPVTPDPQREDVSAAADDEAALRGLIRDVLREELEGPMGERVTRNLRKLIRSELARAFAARGIS